jgi:pimeloyl-ACP methyl ester carboxylesterase/membrane protein DedA with SNARE-associated domain
LRSRTRTFLLVYAALLLASYGVRLTRPASEPTPGPGEHFLPLPPMTSEGPVAGDPIRFAYLDAGPTEATAGAVMDLPIVLIHGSPGDKDNFRGMLPSLARQRRILVPDLPGFGHSEHAVPEYSVRAHAQYVRAWLDALGVERCHVVGFSMGGGVALNLWQMAPERVASITMLAAIGVQEMELMGDYTLNHLIHGAQLAGLWILRDGFPHFGALDNTFLGIPYARNFYDTDQRPLRGYLEAYPGPMLILHSNDDVLVPVAAALEHHRLVPQSELELLDKNHFFVFTDAADTAARLERFVTRVEAGEAPTRANAPPERLQTAGEPFDPGTVPPVSGLSLVVLLLLIALATLLSEDLTCIVTGLMVAMGRIGFFSGTLACLVGIFLGDMMLYAAGRFIGRPALGRIPFRWLVQEESVERSAKWFARRGTAAILLSRFIPGTRLPTYFAAGLFRAHFWRFAAVFLLAAALWTPILVGLAVWVGAKARVYLALFEQYAWVAVVLLAVLILVGTRILMPAMSYPGRQLLRGAWRRKVRWEYWPLGLFYLPVVAWIVWLGVFRYRRPTLFTAANPAMPAAGLVGESKSDILAGLAASGTLDAFLPRTQTLPPGTATERLPQVAAFLERHALSYPVVLKPDAGQRGQGVIVVHTATALPAALETFAEGEPVLLQEHIAGPEIGAFYIRRPGDPQGFLFSITDKRLPTVLGDGKRTLEELILAEASDFPLLAKAPHYLRVNHHRLDEIPAMGERVPLVELGTHALGAVFLDGMERWKTPALEAAVERVAQGYEGFYFGRFDLRAASPEALRAGDFRILEANGVTSEATHIYDPKYSLLDAYRILFQQWRWAFEVGKINAQRGAPTTSVGTLLRLWWNYLRGGTHRPGSVATTSRRGADTDPLE